MNRMKMGIAALVIAVLAITAVVVGAQPPMGNGGSGRGQGLGVGRGGEFQVIAEALGVDLATLQSDLQSGKTIADIAEEKNVELSTIVDAVVAKQQENLTAAVTDGRLTQEQADAQITLLKANLNALFTRKFDQQLGNRPGFGLRGNGMLDVVATALGVDATTLQTDLEAGKTIADIAKEKNVELGTVVDAVVAEHEAALKTAVTDGRLTQEQADAQITLLKADLTARFAQTIDANGRGGMGMGGFGGFNGQGGPGRGDNRPGGHGNGGPMGPNGKGGLDNNAPVPPEATPEATASANA